MVSADLSNPQGTRDDSSRQEWTSLLDDLLQAVMLYDTNGQCLEANSAAMRILGLDRETILASRLPELWSKLFAGDGSALKPEDFPGVVALRDGTQINRKALGWAKEDASILWLEVSAKPLHGGAALVSFDDITEHRLQARKLERITQLYATLSQVNQAIVWAATAESLLDKICEAMVKFGKFNMAWIGRNNPANHEVTVASQFGDDKGFLVDLKVRSDNTPLGQGGAGKAIREARTCVLNDFLGSSCASPWHDAAVRSGFASSAAIPIRKGGKVFGALVVYSSEKDFFGTQELGLLEEAAGDVTFSLDNRELEAQRKQAEAALQIEREKARQYLSVAEVILVAFDTEARVTLLNRKGYSILGYEEGELVGQDWFRVCLPADEYESVSGVFKRVLAGDLGAVEYNENCIVRRDGEKRLIAWHNSIIKDELGKITGILSSGEDITERRAAEEFLRSSEAKLNLALVSAEMGVWTWDIQANVRHFDERVCQLLGINKEAFKGSQNEFLQVVLQDDHENIRVAWNKTFNDNQPYAVEYRVRWQDGSIHTICARGKLERDETGQPIQILGIIWDITERKQAEIALIESEEHFRSTIENAQAGYFNIDLDGRFQYVNNAWLWMHGFDSSQDIIGQHFSFTQVKQDLAKAEEVIKQLSAGNSILHGTFSRQRKDGTVGYHTFSAWPVFLHGQIAYFEGFIIDETDREQAEAALRENEHKFRTFFENLVEGAALHELVRDENGEIRDYRILDVNPAFQIHTGIDPTYARGRLATEVYSTSVAPFLEAYSMVALEGTPLAFETYFPPLGKHFQISVISPTYGQFATLFEDITERKQKEAALLDTTQRLKLATASARSGVWDLNVQSGSLTWDDRMFELYGVTQGETQGTVQDWMNGLHPEDLERAITEGEAALRGEAPYDTEFRVKHKDGDIHWIKANGIVLRDENNNPVRMIGLNRDITERKLMENALREGEERFRNLFDRASVGILVFSASGTVRDVNSAFAQMHGYSVQEILAMHLNDLIAPETFILTTERIPRLLAGESLTFQVDHLHKDGHIFPIEVSASPIQLNGETFILGFNSDITERKAAETKIRCMTEDLEKRVKERTAQLESANKEMEAFSYSVSHDLRTPLRSIDGFSQALLEDHQDQLDETGKHYLARIHNSTKRMGNLIDDLLKLSRTSRSELTIGDCDLTSLCRKVANDLTLSQPERIVEVSIQPGMITSADHNLMQVVLENLLRNAWKFSSRSQNPKIEVRETVSTSGERTFFIRDNGAGFDMAHADKLFTAFQRLHSETDYEGTGIGLAIVQRIISRHGGRIWAEAELGKGATFFFTLP